MNERNWYTRVPLYVRILIGLAIGLALGLALRAAGASAAGMEIPGLISGIILKVLGALAPPLILIAVLDMLVRASSRWRWSSGPSGCRRRTSGCC